MEELQALDLSPELFTALQEAGVNSVATLVSASPASLARLEPFRKMQLREVELSELIARGRALATGRESEPHRAAIHAIANFASVREAAEINPAILYNIVGVEPRAGSFAAFELLAPILEEGGGVLIREFIDAVVAALLVEAGKAAVEKARGEGGEQKPAVGKIVNPCESTETKTFEGDGEESKWFTISFYGDQGPDYKKIYDWVDVEGRKLAEDKAAANATKTMRQYEDALKCEAPCVKGGITSFGVKIVPPKNIRVNLPNSSFTTYYGWEDGTHAHSSDDYVSGRFVHKTVRARATVTATFKCEKT